MRKRRNSDEELTLAVCSSTSIRQVLSQLGLVAAGGNYAGIKQRIARLRLNTAHFTGRGWKRGDSRPVTPAKPLPDLLRPGTHVQSFKLKKRLLAEGVKERRCESCDQMEWLGQPIPLELHHLNGDGCDNRLENLALLCPNCHALTPNYRGKKLAKCRDETAPS